MWAYVKSNMTEETFIVLEEMVKDGVTPDEGCYNAVIWACTNDPHKYYKKVIEQLRLMKLNGCKRQTHSYNGALTTLVNAGNLLILTIIYFCTFLVIHMTN